MTKPFITGACAAIAGIYVVFFPLITNAEEDASTSSHAVSEATTSEIVVTTTSNQAVLASMSAQGAIQATFERDSLTGMWTVYAAGTYSGLGGNAVISDTFIYGANDQNTDLGTQYLGKVPDDPAIPASFNFSLGIPAIPLTWTKIGFGIHLSDNAGKTLNVRSGLFPRIWQHPVLLDHAIGGSVIDAPNFVPSGIPAGVGIPHSLINGIPDGEYYAVVFFDGLIGCPSGNYTINSFIPGSQWGFDAISPDGGVYKAWSTPAGGCIQPFYIDSHKGSSWMWGALSNTDSANAIGDAQGVPAFAICGTKEACDRITPTLTGASSTPSDTPPAASTTPATEKSSLLFLPGMKGSRLYEKDPLCIVSLPGCDVPLWLPLADAFVSKLFLNTHGKSNREVYAKESDVLAEAFGFSFYDSFIKMMDTAKENHTYGNGWDWKAIAYDWRLSLPDLLTNGVLHGNRIDYGKQSGLPYIEASLRALASTSPTGKVTIVAHSNGGLVAKALLEKLGNTEATTLVDSLVLVGTPQSGAPRALGALLFGEGESIPPSGLLKNKIVSAVHAREFGLNAPMAYHLLPSPANVDLQNPSHPLIAFEPGTLLAKERRAYGETIDSSLELHDFALASEGGRSAPMPSDIQSPSILNPELLSYAEQEHASLDTWIPPAGIQVYQIGGYGVDTISGIDLYDAPSKSTPTTLAYRPLFTQEGDGTVPINSAFLMNNGGNVESVWVNLGKLNEPRHSHADLLEMPYVQQVLHAILSGTYVPEDATIPARMPLVNAMPHARMAFFLHGSGSLRVANEDGQSAGLVSNDGSSTGIPGSESGTFGNVSYVIVPSPGRYTVQVRGEDTSLLSLDLQNLYGNDVTASSTAAALPFTASSVASFMVTDTITHSSAFQLDEDGDGVYDQNLTLLPGHIVFGTSPSASSTVSATSVGSSGSVIATGMPRKQAHVSANIPTTQPLAYTAPQTQLTLVASSAVDVAHKAQVVNKPNGYVQKERTVSTSTASIPLVRVIPHTETHLSLWQRIVAFVRNVVLNVRIAFAR